MFEEEDDALRYSLLLEAQDFPAEITVERLPRADIEEFCDSSGYSYYLIDKDFRPSNDFERMLLVPPERNRDSTDWEIEGLTPPTAPDEDSEMSNDELDRIRRSLEGLL